MNYVKQSIRFRVAWFVIEKEKIRCIIEKNYLLLKTYEIVFILIFCYHHYHKLLLLLKIMQILFILILKY